mmetsp:Transcript_11341/g.20859  ORF Transcript_11341/g.20859 Transcript_11341/m.20859 type:complete len:271 (+) Transcript_11341:30-842(+)
MNNYCSIGLLLWSIQLPLFANGFSVYILRHGETDANASGVIQGSANFSRLTQNGKMQAAQVPLALQGVSISTVFASPLSRALETWEILHETATTNKNSKDQSDDGLVLPSSFTTLHNLREIDFYDWQGKDRYELQTKEPDSWQAWQIGDPNKLKVYDSFTSTIRYPLQELWDRADFVWDEILNHPSQQASLIAAHGSLGQALLGTAMGWDATYFRRHEFPNCGLVEIEWQDDVQQENYVYNNNGRPLATRWRWKWPNPTEEWNYHPDECI